MDLRYLGDELRVRVRGQVLEPGQEGYDSLVTGFNQAIVNEPIVAVDPVDALDVVEVVRTAAAAGAPVLAFGEGHGFHRGFRRGVLIKMRSLRSVTVDVIARTANIGAGTKWQEVIDVAREVELCPLSGSDAGVGVVGYVLGGGLGPLGRTYGYAADAALEFQVVTGKGELLSVNAHTHSDLFWSLRGGNTGLGIVVSVKIGLVPSDNVHGDAFYYAAEDLEEVLRAWVGWCDQVPATMNSYAYVVRVPDDPDLPEHLRARTLLELLHVYVGDRDDGARLVAPLLDLATPVFHDPGRTRENMVASKVVTDGGVYLDTLDDEAIDAILEIVGPGVNTPLVSVGLQLLGGALGEPQTTPNAVTGRDAAYALHAVGDVPELVDTEIPDRIRELHRVVEPWTSPTCLPNYIGRANAPGAFDRAWAADVRARLDEVRRLYDPDGVVTDRSIEN